MIKCILSVFALLLFSSLIIKTSFCANLLPVNAVTFLSGYQIIDLYAENYESFSMMTSEWSQTIDGKGPLLITNCSSVNFLGQTTDTALFLERSYSSLPSHTALAISIRFALVDLVYIPTNQNSYVKIGDDFIFWGDFVKVMPYGNSGLCGSPSNDDELNMVVVGEIAHSSDNLKVEIMTGIQLVGFEGIRDVQLLLKTDPVTTPINPGCCYGNGSLFYSCQCSTKQFWNGAGCQNCHANCLLCKGPTQNDCLGCEKGFSFNGVACVACTSGCLICNGSNVNQCFHCDSSHTLFSWNNTCGVTCASPFILKTIGEFKTCETPCPTNYLKWDNTCSDFCPLPYKTRIEGNGKFCDLPCPTTSKYYYDTDSQCRSTCTSPYQIYDTFFCTPCLGKFFRWDNTCSSTCDPPLKQRIIGQIKYCELPCSGVLKYYYDTDSQCRSTCTYPYDIYDFFFCTPCMNKFFKWDNTCSETCDPPRKQRIVGKIKYCDSPCDSKAFPYYYEKDSKCRAQCEYPYSLSEGVFCAIELPLQEKNQIHTTSSAMGTANGIISSIGTTISLINFNNPTSVYLYAFQMMLESIKYIDVKYPPRVQYSFDTQIEIPFDYITKAPDVISKHFPVYNLPFNYERYQVPSSFLVNSWRSLLTLSLVFLGIIFSLISGVFERQDKKSYFVLDKITDTFRWNFSLEVFTSFYGDIALYSSLELRTVHFDNAGTIASFSLCILLNILAFLVFAKMIWILRGVWRLKISVSKSSYARYIVLANKQLGSFKVVFEGYKDESIIQQAFLCLAVARMYITSTVIGYLFDYPLTQAIIMTILSLVMLLYLAIKRPLRHRTEFIQNVFQEIMMSVIYGIVITLAIFDHLNAEKLDTRNQLGDVIIYTNMGYAIISALYLTAQTLINIRDIYIRLREYCQRKNATQSQNFRPSQETPEDLLSRNIRLESLPRSRISDQKITRSNSSLSNTQFVKKEISRPNSRSRGFHDPQIIQNPAQDNQISDLKNVNQSESVNKGDANQYNKRLAERREAKIRKIAYLLSVNNPETDFQANRFEERTDSRNSQDQEFEGNY